MEKIGVLFVCHGNICRSPMAEFVFNHMIAQKHLDKQFFVASAATSREEIGNSVHQGTATKLRAYGIPMKPHQATQLTPQESTRYAYLVGMDSQNITNMQRMLPESETHKIHRLLDFSSAPRDIADPWYTGNFDETYQDITEGCLALLTYLIHHHCAAHP